MDRSHQNHDLQPGITTDALILLARRQSNQAMSRLLAAGWQRLIGLIGIATAARPARPAMPFHLQLLSLS